MVKFLVERWEDIQEEINPLLKDHWLEVESDQDLIPMDVDHRKYRLVDEAGGLVTCTVRDGNLLVGYMVMLMDFSMHHKNVMAAEEDLMYIKPAYRGTNIAKRLMCFCEKELKDRGVKVVLMHMKSINKQSRLLKHLGYYESEVTFRKYIGV